MISAELQPLVDRFLNDSELMAGVIEDGAFTVEGFTAQQVREALGLASQALFVSYVSNDLL